MANPVSIALPGNIPPLEFAKHANWVDTKIKVVKVDVKVAPNALQKECQNLVVAWLYAIPHSILSWLKQPPRYSILII